MANGFNTLRIRFWCVNTAGGNTLKTVSPILVTVGNPDQNTQTARLNDQFPIYFDGNETGDGWSLIHRRNGQRFEGHIGIISLSSVVDEPDFSDGMIGLDMVTMLMAGADNQAIGDRKNIAGRRR